MSEDNRPRAIATMRALSDAHPFWSGTSMAHAYEAIQLALGLEVQQWMGDEEYEKHWMMDNIEPPVPPLPYDHPKRVNEREIASMMGDRPSEKKTP